MKSTVEGLVLEEFFFSLRGYPLKETHAKMTCWDLLRTTSDVENYRASLLPAIFFARRFEPETQAFFGNHDFQAKRPKESLYLYSIHYLYFYS